MSAIKYKVIIADDERDIVDLISAIVSPTYIPITASTGEEALAILEQHGSEVACVISDFKMPVMNGMQLRQAMLPRFKDIPFILVSGFVSREDALAGIEIKISAFEAKPFDNEKLMATIKRVSADREGQILERVTLEQIFIEEASNIVEDLEPLIMSLEQNPSDMETINTIFRLVHTIKGSSGVLESGHIRGYVHKFEDLLSKIKSGNMIATPPIVSILLQGFDVVGQMIACLRNGTPWDKNVEELAKIFNGGNSTAPVSAAQNNQAAASPARAEVVKDTVSVPAALLDEFMELSGEITVIRNMVNKLVRVIEKETPGNRNVQHLSELLDEMHKINSGMQGRLIETRKLPLAKVFRPLPRTVRDTAKLINKQVNLKVEGDTTRVDTSLAQVLSDSLIHIVRNSIDHGIEPKEKRLERKKPAEGNITIRAVEQGEAVLISIQDDGGGLDTSRIKKKAVERGLYTAEEIETLSEQKVFGLIFESGFSTAAQVTDVSGRGVGMDMVRSSVQKVKGHIDIDSTLGKGTKFTLTLPIPKSVLIISSLLVEADRQSFAIPQDSISRLLRLEGTKIKESIYALEGAYVLRFEEKLLPVVDLAVVLGRRSPDDLKYLEAELVNILIVRTEKETFALAVDRILDAEEIVVKSVGKYLERLDVYTGATFMGDGSVGLILSAEGIANRAGIRNKAGEIAPIESIDLSTKKETHQELLTFGLYCHSKYGVPLSMIHRLEEFPRDQFQHIGDRTVMIYRDQTIPLINLSLMLGLPIQDADLMAAQTPVPVFVVKIHDRFVGFMIREILDVMSVPSEMDVTVRDREEIAGTFEVNGQVVSVLDIVLILDKSGLLKSYDPDGSFRDMMYGIKIVEAEPAHIDQVEPDTTKSQKTEDLPATSADQGWGIF